MRTFFFAPESPRPLAALRIALGLVLLYYAAVRWPYAIELYSSDGAPMPLFPGTWLEPPALDARWTVVLHSVYVFALCGLVLGWRTRLSAAVALVFLLWFGLLDVSGTFKKYSVIAAHLLFLLAVSQCGAVWSIDRRLSPERHDRCRLAAAWPRRLMQLFLCSVYLGAAYTKMRRADFASGDLPAFSLQSDLWGGTAWGLWLSTHPKWLVLAAAATVLFETLFPALVWVPRLRRAMLLLAAGFHLTLAATMHLGIFSPVMLAGLLAFLIPLGGQQPVAPARAECSPQ
ncbi:MAG: HTTM domain-containing protein [Planctomycetaceae bacterium]